jgi:AcrR family transcriptional regulator
MYTPPILSRVLLYSGVITLDSVARKVKTRTQNSTLRREQAALTRARIIEGAAAVFELRGYEGARIEDIAKEAGVAVPTVYKVFTNKRNLLKASVDEAMIGGGTGEVKRQAWFREQLEEPIAEDQLRLIARNARRIYDRAGQLLEVVRAAAASDRDIEALWQTINNERLTRSRISVRRLATKAKLRTTVPGAARTLWTLSGPELYVLQIRGGGLAPDDYERWLGDLLVAALLGA